MQAWQTPAFPDDAPDSQLEVLLEEAEDGTKVRLTPGNLPEDQVDSYQQGWDDFYFKPMKKYFSKSQLISEP